MQPRRDHRARLEPAAGILHGAGQDPVAVRDYTAAVGAERAPLIWMTYAGLNGNLARWGAGLARDLAAAPGWMIPQIGLSMTRDSHPEDHYEQRVAAGEFDAAIQALVDALAALGRPAYLRIGYEFNGPWNGYQPASFVAAWRRIAAAIRARDLPVALVWCAGLTLDDRPIDWAYWPGDDVVDWCGIDLFFPEDLHDRRTAAFLDRCETLGRPVMIGESTPRTVGTVKADAAWARWFQPYLRTIAERPGIKAFCYINWEWQEWSVKCAIDWLDWGDGRIDRNPDLAARWRGALADPVFIHGGDEAAVRRVLRTG
ncbi:MAG: hypothetical protein RLZZ127_3280 [Planctomycetota bacterium]|jgi:hypothetical protein